VSWGRIAVATAVLVGTLACAGLPAAPDPAPPPAGAAPAPAASSWHSRTLCRVADEEVLLSCSPFGDSPVGVLSVCADRDGVIFVRHGKLGKVEHQVPRERPPGFNPVDWYDVDPPSDAPTGGPITLLFSVGHEPWTLTDDGGLALTRGKDGPVARCAVEVTGSLAAVRSRIHSVGGVARPPMDWDGPP
jgi:hypothetical protein